MDLASYVSMAMAFREAFVRHSGVYGADCEYIWAGFMDAVIRQMQ